MAARNITIKKTVLVGNAEEVAKLLRLLDTNAANIDISDTSVVLSTDKSTVVDLLVKKKQGLI